MIFDFPLLNILYTECFHLLFSLPLAYICFTWYQRKGAILCLLSSLAIDIDHLVDVAVYYGFSGLFTGAVHDVLHGMTSMKNNSFLYIPLHSYELVLVLLMSSYFRPAQRKILIPIALGVFYHLLTDIVTNDAFGIRPWDYSALLRLWLALQ